MRESVDASRGMRMAESKKRMPGVALQTSLSD
jgi:hypothetical protein